MSYVSQNSRFLRSTYHLLVDSPPISAPLHWRLIHCVCVRLHCTNPALPKLRGVDRFLPHALPRSQWSWERRQNQNDVRVSSQWSIVVRKVEFFTCCPHVGTCVCIYSVCVCVCVVSVYLCTLRCYLFYKVVKCFL